jgi:broad specificity phosphatase PhoE
MTTSLIKGLATSAALKSRLPTSFYHASSVMHSSQQSNDIDSKRLSAETKKFIFVRHGVTEMNEKLETMPWFSENFVDAELWDTRLSARGIREAIEAHHNISNSYATALGLNDVEVVLASPLTRALQTAELLFHHHHTLLPEGITKISHPLLTERLYLSSEVGRPGHVLSNEFPAWDFSAVSSDQPWWYTHPASNSSTTTTTTTTTTNNNSRHPQKNLHNHNNGQHNHNHQHQQRTHHSSAVANVQVTGATAADANAHVDASAFHRCTIRHPAAKGSSHEEYGVTMEIPSPATTTTPDSPVPPPYVEWRPPGKYCCEGEPIDVFRSRIIELKEWLLSRPEQNIAVVAHWGVIRALTGKRFKNCEVQVVYGTQFLEVPDVSDVD